MIEARLQLSRPGFELDVDLRLPESGITALFGPSGCGKTTVLRALAGLERATGRVALGPEVWQDDARRAWLPTHCRPVGYVIQEAALFPHLTVRGNLDYARRRSPPGAANGPVSDFSLEAVVALLGIAPLMARRPGTLSGGERQRVAIARALATAPRLLLMDEPLAALDAARKAEILPYLERLHRQLRLPVIYVTHALDEAALLADHLVLMRAGRVQASGPLAELMSRPDLPLGPNDEAGVVIEAAVLEHDAAYGLSRLGFEGGQLWTVRAHAAPGERLRVRVLARDVSVARQAPAQTSVLNLLPVVLQSLQWGHGAQASTALLRLQLPGSAVHLLARVTRRSVDLLALRPGEALFAQVKGVALMQGGAAPQEPAQA
jgi:molybdate transport system ATP-binding protein